MSSGIGIQELVLLFVIGLLILGPERLPRVASQIGRWVGRARRTANQLRYQLEREIALADIEKSSPSKRSGAAATGKTGTQQPAPAEGAPAEGAPAADAPADAASGDAATVDSATADSAPQYAAPSDAAPGVAGTADETLARSPAGGSESAEDPAERA
jgi:sec-independent protein translocase protein TatB